MSTSIETPRESEADELPADPLAFRRIWTKPSGRQGASSAVLKAFGVLYDAGRPLTRQELLEGLLPRLDPYEKAYLQAWDARRRGKVRNSIAKRDGLSAVHSPILIRECTDAAKNWLTSIFCRRVYAGNTLIRDKDGRYRPGSSAPRMQTADGRIPFTPETRTAQELTDRNASQQHAMELEWKRVQPFLEGVAGDLRLLVVAFLARRYAGAVKTGSHRQQVSETTLRGICGHLLRADRPAVQRAILEQVLKWACESPTDIQR